MLLFLASQVAEAAQLFDSIDADGDGCLSRDEMIGGLLKKGLHESEIDTLLEKIDGDSDGMISRKPHMCIDTCTDMDMLIQMCAGMPMGVRIRLCIDIFRGKLDRHMWRRGYHRRMFMLVHIHKRSKLPAMARSAGRSG